MEHNKTRRILAVIALVFMAVFTVTLVIVFIDPGLWNGAFGYMALVSGLLGIGLFLVIKFLLKSEDGQGETQTEDADKPDGEPAESQTEENKSEETDA